MKNKFSIAISLAVVLAMLLTSLAYADNVINDVVAGGNDTITSGGSTIINYRIQQTGGGSDGQQGCNASDGSPATVTINTPAGVTVDTSGASGNQVTLTYTTCGTNQPATFTSSTPGEYSITVSVSDSGTGTYSTNQATFTLHVNAPANTAPSLTLPGNLTAEATSAAGAAVSYTATATDAEDDPDPTPSCSPASGSTFPLGTTTVNCSVMDSGGLSASSSFTVTVQDTTAPAFTLPSNLTVEATSSAGATVTFTASATDLVDGAITPSCSPASGSTFPLGTTTVNCSATDTANNTGSKSFTVTVLDTTPPTISGTPSNITAEATSAAGAAVTYTSPTASDLVDGSVSVTCLPASGSTFALDETIVTCTATDTRGNSAQATFKVKIQDTTAPTLTLPSNMIVPATSTAGTVVTFSASATDIVDGAVAVSCTPASGSTFAPGTTTVNCSATDAADNTAAGSFTVSVKFQLSGFYQPVDMNGVLNTVKGGSTVPLKFEVFAGSTELTDTAVVSTLVKQVTCNAVAGEDTVEVLATGGTSLRYDAVGGQFIFNWQTPKLPGKCYSVMMTTQDGSSLIALFKLK